jgi:ADP-heptose:LPS heptosyltransferase
MNADAPPSGRVVAFRLGHLGDVVLATGVLEYWRRTRGLTFAFVTRQAQAPVFMEHPAVDEVYVVREPHLESLASWIRTCRELAARYAGRGLVDLHGTLRSRILSLLWSGPVWRYPKAGWDRRLLLATGSAKARERLRARNVPQRYALAIEGVAPPAGELTPVVRLSERERAWAGEFLAGLALTGERPLAALHPYATHPNKAWPVEHWRALIQGLKTAGWDALVLGRTSGGAASPFADLGPRDLTGRTDLRQTCALLARSQGLVTGDSGPLHLGTAVGVPVTALFGPTGREWGFFPSGPRDTVLQRDMPCRPCSLHGRKPCARGPACLAAITPEEVLAEVVGKFSTGGGR